MSPKSSKQQTIMDKTDDVFAVSSMMNEVDSIIAQNLRELSPEDREKSYHSLHGISGELHETPLLIAQSLGLMEQEINQIHVKDAYNMAMAMKPEYVQDSALRMKFLRGERFSVRPAAEKLTKFFELKRYLFGASKLVKEIEQDDLNEADIAALYSGYVQWLPLKDRSQRTVSIMFPMMNSNRVPVLSRMRVSFYLRMIAMEDVSFQMNGTVAIVSAAEAGSDSFGLDFAGWRDGAKRSAQLSDALPGTTHGVHICFPRHGSFRSFLFSSLINIAVSVLNPVLKVRVRIHRGETMEECVTSLRSFGITTEAIPKSPQDNEYQTNLLLTRRNLEQRRRTENCTAGVSCSANLDTAPENFGEWVCGPSRDDVILGRGHRSNLHPGNMKLRQLVEDTKTIYDNSTKNQKTEIAVRLVLAIQEKGRFLHDSDVGWVEVTEKAARKKVSHLFRDACKPKRKKPPSANVKKTSLEVVGVGEGDDEMSETAPYEPQQPQSVSSTECPHTPMDNS